MSLLAARPARWLAALALLVASASCAGAPPQPPARVEAREGYALTFPAPVETRTGHEGPFSFRIDHARARGARFEAAWFGFPEALDAVQCAALSEKIDRALSGGEGTRVVSRKTTSVSGRDAEDLVVDRADGRRGYHRIFYPSPRSMLQVSAVGPSGGEWEREVEGFWASLVLDEGLSAPESMQAAR
jgi:hypothetical protein